jgi:predicted metal-dependent phosphoesterase TrpH
LTADPVAPTVGAMSATLGRADLHVHPVGNGTSLGDPATFLAALLAAGLDLVGLTDHDRVDVAAELAARGADAGLVLVVGEEIATREGHVVGLGLRDLVAPGAALGDTIAEIHAQGGIAVIAHPLLAIPTSASRSILEELAQGPAERRPDALEAFNARVAWLPGYRRRVERLAAATGYAVVGCSDAHRPGDVGRGVTRYQGRTFDDLRAAIAAGETATEGRAFGVRDLLRRGRRRPATGGQG